MLERYAVFEFVGRSYAPALVERFDSEMQAARMAENRTEYFAIDLQEGVGVVPPQDRI